MQSSTYVLAVDLGTSGPKVALVSNEGAVIGKATESVELLLDGTGGAEQDPRAWWSAIVTATRRTLAATSGTDVAAISVTSQWSGTVAVDVAGEPIGNAIIWMDSRGAAYLDELRGSGPVRFEGFGPLRVRRWVSVTGGGPSGSG
ncbi:MAG TPA: FGGY family carbohydrate kinase, partial [Acidimicrobiia bacterium]|nr:FGGY family carbohydrate kinase [Acidimicrobiia bacterium]